MMQTRDPSLGRQRQESSSSAWPTQQNPSHRKKSKQKQHNRVAGVEGGGRKENRQHRVLRRVGGRLSEGGMLMWSSRPWRMRKWSKSSFCFHEGS